MSEPRLVGLAFADEYLWYDTGLSRIGYVTPYPFPDPIPHVSSPELIGRAKLLADLSGLTETLTRLTPRPVTDEQLLVFHTAEYLARVAAVSAAGGGDAGRGAPLGAGGDRLARLAAGGTVAATEAVLAGTVRAAYALVRPPGHHAMADHGMGFCVYGNVVIAARHAQRALGARKMLILDWDVHHGNGTQAAFWSDPSVLFMSIHQDNLFPVGWGAADQVGAGAGAGFTVNVPLPAGTGNRGYQEAMERIIVPIARQYAPDLIFISAGQDASIQDPLGRMCLTLAGYQMLTEQMLAVAAEVCAGRVVVTQEGGYAPTYAPYCTATILHTLAGAAAAGVPPVADPYGARQETFPPSLAVGLDAAAAIERVIAVQRQYWSV